MSLAEPPAYTATTVRWVATSNNRGRRGLTVATKKGDGEQPDGLYPVRVVEQLTGLTRRQIRYYEEQGLLAPNRSEGGHRLYAPGDVDRLLLIKSLMEKGFRTIEAVKRCLASDLRFSGQNRVSQLNYSTSRGGTPAAKRPMPPVESDADNYFQRHKRWPQG